ncbi:CGNR zinc finger domain-containing protein [Sphaerisporangium corydalis]|uniref:CGNR zinc finger domain-containing protein n=1 Tax=Sphaerisporangium corydalis TaxID=1441875 RepID=A0ABV9ERE2_9ACTN|nr:ABATE domain-containing protein [Sphaerisporangium corydalis]
METSIGISSPTSPRVSARELAAMDFRFRSGRRSLDLAATLGGRHRRPIERLGGPGDLARWFGEAGLLAGPPPVDDDRLILARELREAIYRCARSVIGGAAPAPGDVAVLNAHAAVPPLVPVLDAATRAITWTAPDLVAAALSEVARDAVDLLGGPQAERIRECAGDGCSLLFVDVSGAGRRRWCAMGGCGNLEKVRRHRRRSGPERIAGERPGESIERPEGEAFR